MSEYTKGEWKVGKNGSSVVSNSDEGLTINGATGDDAIKYYGGNLICESVSKANALLISKAPEMLEAMQDFCNRVDNGEVKSIKTYNKFKQLIEQLNTKS